MGTPACACLGSHLVPLPVHCLPSQVPYVGSVHDIALLQDGHTLVVALKGTNYLHLLDLQHLEVGWGLVGQQAGAGGQGCALCIAHLHLMELGVDEWEGARVGADYQHVV